MSTAPDEYEVYAEFGMAAEKAQVLEVAAGNVALSYLTFFYNTDKISSEVSEMFHCVIDDLNQKTLGRLLAYVKSTATHDDVILRTIDDALEKRNYLMHHFFRTHNYAFFSVEGRQAMIDNLKEIRSKLALAVDMLNAISAGTDMLAGRDRALDENVDKELRAKGKRVRI
jgi:hypothetical protein